MNDFRYKTNFMMGDLSGEQMFVKKQSFLFGAPQTPQVIFARNRHHKMAKNKSTEALFALN